MLKPKSTTAQAKGQGGKVALGGESAPAGLDVRQARAVQEG